MPAVAIASLPSITRLATSRFRFDFLDTFAPWMLSPLALTARHDGFKCHASHATLRLTEASIFLDFLGLAFLTGLIGG